MMKETLKQIQDTISPALTDKDRVYNRVARDEPAFISLLFPSSLIMILNFKYDIISNENPIIYIFNSILCLGLMLPALFFLYKQVIRSLSVLIVEKVFFKIFNPNHAYFLRTVAGNISNSDVVTLSKYIPQHIKLKDNLREHNWIWCKKRLCEDIKSTMNFIRNDEIIKNNTIIFENNCMYGFFRNLVGGISLNLIMMYSLLLFYPSECLSKVFLSATELTEVKEFVNGFLHSGTPILWIMFVLCIILAWQARYRHCTKMVDVFIASKSNVSAS